MIEAQKKIYLCRPNGKILTQLNGVDTESVEYGVHVKDFNDISFTVQRYIVVDGKPVETNGYNDLHVGMNILLEGLDMFQIQEPTISNDGVKEYKTVKGYSLEHEFMEKSWLGLKVNTGEDGSLEYQSKSNLDEFGFSKQYVTFYRPNNSGQTEYSLIHRILEKMPNWSVDDDDIDGVLRDKKIKIDEENINLYALLTSVIAPKAECIFLFDTINRKIKAVAKESLDKSYYDTNIFVSMRNLVRTLDIQTNEDSVFTVFNVAGDDDLNIRYVNYNDRYIYDLSYFMSEPWMNQQLIDKITAWSQWRENNRNLYIEKSKHIEELNDRIYMITYQTPNDGDDWQQWDEMSLDGLNGAYRMFYSYLVAILASADDDPSYDENGDYIIRRNGNNEIDDDYYKPKLLEDSLGYYTYYEIMNYILPNIEIAIDNKGKVKEEKVDYVKAYETNWELYGLNLLDEKKKQISDQIINFQDYAKAWDDMTDQEKAKVNEMTYKTNHQIYAERVDWMEGLTARENELNAEKQQVQDEINSLTPEIEELRNKALITHEDWGLTKDELELFTILCKYTDYTNNNIVTTGLTTTTSKFENQEELYQDSVSKLSEVSQPQYSFNVDIDNFFDIPEFAAWKDKFHLLRFMRVGIRDDYSVKLRLIGYTTNPCEIDPMLTVEFSNFITSKSGRSDLTELLQLESGSASSNSISVGKGNATDAEEYATNLFFMMSRSGMLSSNPRSSASGTVNSVFTGVSTANLIDLYTTTGYITDAVMSEAKVTDYLDAVKVNAATMQAGTIIADRILLKGNGSGILYQLNNLGGLESENMSTLDGYVLTENTVTADKIVANSITAREITTENIEGTNGWINFHDGTFLYRNPNDNTKYLSWNGSNLLIAGEIYARDGGDIGGFKISTTANTGTTVQGGHCFPQSLYLQTSNTTEEFESGITNGKTSGYLLPTQKAFYISRIDKGAAWSTATDMFYVRHDGKMYAKDADIEGKITSGDGKIGNWNINDDSISSAIRVSGHIYQMSLKSPKSEPDGKTAAILVTDNNILKFAVNYNGSLTATSGFIGYTSDSNPGWVIKSGAIYSYGGPDTVSKSTAGTYVGIDGIQNYKNANAYVRINDGSITANNVTLTGGTIKSANYSYSSGTYSVAGTLIDLSTGLIRSKNFCIDTSGNANISGKITATSGSLSNLTIGGYLTTNASRTAYNQAISGMTMTTSGIGGWGSATQYWNMTTGGALTAAGVNVSGTITATTLNATVGGTIGPWSISSTELSNSVTNGVLTAKSSLSRSALRIYAVSGSPLIEVGVIGADGGSFTNINSSGVQHAGYSTGWLARHLYDTEYNRYVCNCDFLLTFKDVEGVGNRCPISTHRTDGQRVSDFYMQNSTTEGKYRLRCTGQIGGAGASYSNFTVVDGLSDIRLKKNINDTDVFSALDIIKKIKVRSFDWIGTGVHQCIGFIADELEQIDSRLSVGGGYDDKGKMDLKSVDFYYLQGYEVKAIQELSQQISDLKSEIKQLKQQLQER